MLLRTGSALLTGVLLALAFEPVGLSFLVPLAIAGYVLSIHGLPSRRAWVPGLAFGVGFCFVLMFWMRVVGVDAWLALSGLEAAFYGVLGAVTGALGRSRWWPLWVACAWVGTEAVRSTWPFSGMPWGRVSYATADTPWERALPYVGQSGVGFLLALLGTCLAWLVLTPGRRERLLPGAVTLAVLAAGLLPALVPYRVAGGETRTVAVVQGDVPGNGDNVLLDHRQVTRNHVEATLGLAADVADGRVPRPDLVVWPENSTAVDPFADEGINAGIAEAAERIDVPVLVGAMVDAGPEHVLNQGIVWDPETGAGDRFTKRHPVPFGEYIPWRGVFRSNFGRLALIPRDMRSGSRDEPVRIADTLVADAICFDVAYDDGLHAQLREGAELVTVQTSNAMFIHTSQIEQQFEISRLRAIETGRYVAVAAINGISGVVAPDGSVVARAEPRTRSVLVQDVTLSHELTPAVLIGPWLGRLSAVVALLALVPGARSGLLTSRLPYRRQHISDERTA